MDESVVLHTLRAERAAALIRFTAMTSEFDGIVADSLQSNADDEHDPEGSTIAYERALVAALITRAQSHLDDLDHALDRLAAGCYSDCEQCGNAISPERLTALPACHTCFECAAAGHHE
jgi:DnaK suppressor protein